MSDETTPTPGPATGVVEAAAHEVELHQKKKSEKPEPRRPRFFLDVGLYPLSEAESTNHPEWKEIRTFHTSNELREVVFELFKLYFEQGSQVALRLRARRK